MYVHPEFKPQCVSRAFVLALVGMLAGLIGWALGELVEPKTLGNVDDWHVLGKALLLSLAGTSIVCAVVTGAIAFSDTLMRTKGSYALLAGLAGIGLGATVGPIGGFIVGLVGHGIGRLIIGSGALAISVSAAIALSSRPSIPRIQRACTVGLIAGVISQLLGLILVLVATSIRQRSGHPISADTHEIIETPISRFIHDLLLGIAVGAAYPMKDLMYLKATVSRLDGSGHPVHYPLYHGLNRIGSSEASDVEILDDKTVAALHATITESVNGFGLQDAGSPKGVLVNQVRVGQTYLNPGDTIQVGHTVLTFGPGKLGSVGAVNPANAPSQSVREPNYEPLAAFAKSDPVSMDPID
jgi:hypothetical protein